MRAQQLQKNIISINLWVVRHGETFANLKQITQGQQGGELTDKGFEQAHKLGMRLRKQNFDKVFCSDLNRCQQTMQTVREHSVHQE